MVDSVAPIERRPGQVQGEVPSAALGDVRDQAAGGPGDVPGQPPSGVSGEVSSAAPGAAPEELDVTTHDFLKALASPTRQRIMMLFFKGAELSVGEVAEAAGIGQSTASEQLALMRRGGMVTARRDGKVIRYRGDREGIQRALANLQAYLVGCC